MNKKLKKLTVALTAAITAALSAGAFTAFAEDTDIPIDEAHFPDEAFRTYVQDRFGDSLSQDEIANATNIDVRYEDITSLKGIEYFTALTYLDCYSNKLTELDISKNTALETLICGSNDLESLNVSSNDKLKKLHCNSNDLTSLNVSNNTKLTDINCGSNDLGSLNLSSNADLKILECDDIGLTVLDLSSNNNLETLNCFDNHLESLDLTYNAKLQRLNCSFNNTLKSLVLSQNAPLSDLSCQYNQLTSLDLSQHTSLIRLSCSNNQLTSLDVKGCTSLSNLDCSNNQLTSLDVSECDSDIDLSCNNQTYSIGAVVGSYPLTTLPGSFDPDKATNWLGATYDSTAKSLSDFTEALTVTYDYSCGKGKTMSVTLHADSYTEPDDGSVKINAVNFPDDNFRTYISDNFDNENGTKDGKLSQDEIAAVTAIDVSGKSIRELTGIEYFTALTTLNCNNNTLLTSLDVSKNTALTKLTFSGCRISSLNVKGCDALTYIDCKENYELTSLDLSENTKLEYLNCYNNKIGSLDVSNNTNLKELNCQDNLLTSLNVKNCNALTKLICSGNSLTELDTSGCTALTILDCHESLELTSLNVSDSDLLEELHCYNCKLTSLDVSGKASLKLLYCDTNQLTELKLSDCTALVRLDCNDNKLTSLDLSKNTSLTVLNCFSNQLESLDLTKNTSLTELNCRTNHLTSLDLTKNTSLSSYKLFDQTYPIGEVIDSYPLSKLPEGFVSSNAGDWTGAEYDEGTDSLINFSSTSVTYKYDCGKQMMPVTLSLTSYRNPDDVEINEESFPDKNFRDIVSESYDKDGNGYLSKAELNAVTVIILQGRNITDLKGIEYFTALTKLYCDVNQLTSLDLSKNTALTLLQCTDNQLTSLNVSGCTVLSTLYCRGNQLTSLDLTQNASLGTSINLGNQAYFIGGEGTDYSLTKLPEGFDPTKASGWTGATYNSELNSLESFTSTAVYYNYDCGNDKTMKVTLLRSSAYDIPVNEKYFPDEKFRQYISDYIDSDNNNILSKFEISQITELSVSNRDIADLSGIEYFPALTTLNCSDNKLTKLDLSKNTALTSLNCVNNQLTSLDVSGCTALETLWCNDNQLTSLDLSDCTALTDLSCNYQTYSIGKVNVSFPLAKLPAGFAPARASGWSGANFDSTSDSLISFTANSVTYTYNCGNEKTMNVTLTLDSFINFGDVEINEENFPDAIFRQFVSENYDKDGDNVITKDELASIIEIDASNKGISDLKGIEYFTALESLNVGSNKLASLDISKLTALTKLWCENNQLTALDLSGNTNLTYLSCGTNQLTGLDVSGNTKLTALVCYNNKLTALDVSKNTALESLKCDSNQLTELDVSKNADLNYLSCFNNTLTSLDVSSNIRLAHLNCDDSRLASLDVSKNTALENLSCNNNLLTELDVSKNTALKRLYCNNNQLTRLDVSRNNELAILNCENNLLTSLDLSNNTVLKTTYLTGNSFDIGDVASTYDLATLPGNFDSSRASNWQGAVCENGVLTGFTANTITYTYNCGNGISETFTLTATLKPADPDQPETDPIADFAERLYTTLLGRPSDEKGKAEWVTDLKNGRPAADVASGFVLSEELRNQNLSNSEFVDRMYRTLLDREADEAGKAEWVSALDNGCSYGYILNNFAGSQEFTNLCGSYGITAGTYVTSEPRDVNPDLTAFVSRMYTKALDRAYDVVGLNDWTNDYLTGAATAEKIAYGFIFSPEFVNKELPDENYVDVLYRTFFDREADAEGRADWLNEMADGASREDVLNGFLGSQEFANLKAGFNV